MKKNKLAYILVTTLLITSCGSNSQSTSEAAALDYGRDSYMVAEAPASESYNGTDDASRGDSGVGFATTATELKREQMFAKVGRLDNVTEDSKKSKNEEEIKNFDETIAIAENIVSKYNGYFENANYSNYNSKYFDSTIKVPVKDFQNLFNDLKNTGINVYNESSVVNETAGYYSMKSQLEVQKISKARLEDLTKTTTNTKDLLKLYDTYYDLVTDIEVTEAKLSEIESSTSYSTIYYTLSDGNEVVKVDDNSFTSKVKDGFGVSIDFIEDLLIALAYVSVPLILILGVLFVVFKKTKSLVKNKSRLVKRRKKKKLEVNNGSNESDLNNKSDVNDDSNLNM